MIGFIIFFVIIVIWYLYIHYKNKNEFENKNTFTMNYDEKIIIDTIKRFYPIEVKVQYKDLPIMFLAKENKEHFIAVEFFKNSELFMIYLFRSENFNNTTELMEDFNSRDIAFQIEDLNVLKDVLNANSLVV